MAKDTPGSTPPLQPEDNPAVSTVTPDDYPNGRKNANLEAGVDHGKVPKRNDLASGADPKSG